MYKSNQKVSIMLLSRGFNFVVYNVVLSLLHFQDGNNVQRVTAVLEHASVTTQADSAQCVLRICVNRP